ncbi:hypothetical protein ON010_g7932 [Phytophthora cinnamomi]|nr:hypothetical protein ON010_g7932 [Phytophthora cinnamomi]
MEAWYRDEEERRRLEAQRLEDLKLYAAISKTRKRMVELGLSLSTPGAAGIQRLRLLELRIAEKELALKKSREAKGRLDALPAKRNKLRQLMHSFFASSVRKKVEHAVYHQHWDRLVPLFDPAASSSDNRSPDLLNHESENGFTPVLVAIFKGKLRVLRQLLELGAAPNAETAAGITPLLAVVMTGDVVALSILVEFKVDLNHETKSGVNAVLLAADKGRENILRALLEYGANVDGVNSDGRSTLVQAAISGNSDLVRVLLAYGASKELRDRGGKAALDWAIQLRNSSIVSILSSSLTSSNLLAQLKAEDEEEDGEVLSSLSTNRVLRRKRMAEMDKAMRTDDLGRIREHLSTEGLQFSPNYEDDNGNTPLLIVCASGTYADVMLCLKSNCIPIHQNREGINALMIACKRGDVDMIQLLMKCGCSMFTRDFSGRDAFYYLNAFDHPSPAIEYTIKHRARGSDSISALVLGSIISPMNFLKSEYLISLTQADISFTLEGASDGSSRSIDDSISTGPDNANDDNGNEEPVDDSSIRKWGIKQETLKRDKHRLELYEKERGRILAARTRGRRNGLIAPLPLDPAGRLKFPTCDNCQQSRARKRCSSCDQVLCDKCHARLHELAYRRHHQYEELTPELYVGHVLKEVVQTNQENSLQHTVAKSASYVAEMRKLILRDDHVPHCTISPTPVDPEVDKYQRKQRIAKEKAISQMQINVPVAAAKHAAKAGEDTVFTQLAELELAALYTTQKKYDQARTLLGKVERLVADSLGILHPTMLKIAIGRARISQVLSNISARILFEQCFNTMQDALSLFESVLPLDHKDILTATAILLRSLDATENYCEAVRRCRHVFSIRVRSLPASHKCLKEIQEQLDEFIAKRETVNMSNEDLITLHKIEQERRRLERLANESEKYIAGGMSLLYWNQIARSLMLLFVLFRHLENFRHLLMEDPEGLATFLTFAKQEFAEDLVTFWISIEEFKENGIDSKTLRSRAVNTYLTYIKSRRIKVITAAQRKKIKKVITTPGKKLQQTIYDDVQAQIFELVYKGVLSNTPLKMPTSWTTSPRRDVQRYPHEEDFNVYSSPSSSELSSDDEDGAKHVKRVPVTRGRPIHRWTARGKASPYNLQSMRSYYQRRPTNGRLSSPRLAESGEVYVTTVDEDDQQMFIALFYWRRKVIETHFSAWKWVVFALRRSAKQIHRHTRPTKPLPTGYDSAGLPPPRRNLILKRHTSLSNAEESENNRNSNSTTADCKSTRMAMLPPDAIGEQNLQKCDGSLERSYARYTLASVNGNVAWTIQERNAFTNSYKPRISIVKSS